MIGAIASRTKAKKSYRPSTNIIFSLAFLACSAGVLPCLASQLKAVGTRTETRLPSVSVNSTVPVRSLSGLPHCENECSASNAASNADSAST